MLRKCSCSAKHYLKILFYAFLILEFPVKLIILFFITLLEILYGIFTGLTGSIWRWKYWISGLRFNYFHIKNRLQRSE